MTTFSCCSSLEVDVVLSNCGCRSEDGNVTKCLLDEGSVETEGEA